MAELPSGTVAFLFTDVEGSTQLLNAHPDAYRAAIRRHHGLLAEAVAYHGGVVFETVGDAVYAAFARPTDAVAAALAGQLAIHGEDWGDTPIRVRMGLHLGEVELQGAHYFGAPLYRCARLMSTAHGGQVVLSGPTADLARDALPAGADLLDLGEHRLKDLTRPERVAQLLHPGLPAAFPPLRSLNAYRGNLPRQATPLIGRERELGELQKQLGREDVQLLTLTGPGGTGKTRLAIQTAAEVADHFPDGTFFVALAPVADASGVLPAVAEALGVREAAGQPLADVLREHLGDQRLLLVLDNFEHVIEAAPEVARLLRDRPQVKALATSRASLHVYGEHEYRVPPLEHPDPAQHLAADRLTQYEAVRLFIDRAQAAVAGFRVTNETAPAVAEICHRLDGLPLAIELAAARTKLFAPQALLARLDRRLAVLTGGARDLPARQQTIRNTIAWSYDLLTLEEQTALRRLGVFVGGCTMAAAEAVCNPNEELDLLGVVESLLDKSLLRSDDGPDGQPWLTMLQTLREYALERLEAASEAAALRRVHADHFAGVAARTTEELRGPNQAAWMAGLVRDADNYRAAIQWALSPDGDAELAAGIVGSLFFFWYRRGLFTEARRWLAAVLATGDRLPQSGQARAHSAMAVFAAEQGNYDLARSAGETSLALYRASGNQRGAASALGNLAWLEMSLGNAERAAELSEETLAIFRELGDQHNVAICLNRLGRLARDRGNFAQAETYFQEALALRRQMGDQRGIGSILGSLANLAFQTGDNAAAERLLREALTIARDVNEREGLPSDFSGLARAAALAGDRMRAARLWGAAAALREAMEVPLAPKDLQEYEARIEAVRAEGDAEAFAAAWAEGRALSAEEAIAYALEESRNGD